MIPGRLWHFSDATAIAVEDRVQGEPSCKPMGLWVSDESTDDSWSAWCRLESYGIGRNHFAVELVPDVDVLTLSTPEAIREFDFEYSAPDHYRIDWRRVAQRWQGILITPYQWTLRLSDLHWYYAWDCASGCIWDAAAVASVSPVAVEEMAS